MLSLKTCTGNFVKPICIMGRSIDLSICIIRLISSRSLTFGFSTIYTDTVRSHPFFLGIAIGLYHKVLSTQHIIITCQCLNSSRTGISHFRSTCFTLFSSDDDYTITGTCTINSCRAGILQDLDRLNIIRVDRSQNIIRTTRIIFTRFNSIVRSRIYRKTIDNHQRIVTGIDRSSTTDAEVRTTTRLCTYHIYLQTGCLTCQSVTDSRYRTHRSIVHLHRCNSTG